MRRRLSGLLHVPFACDAEPIGRDALRDALLRDPALCVLTAFSLCPANPRPAAG